MIKYFLILLSIFASSRIFAQQPQCAFYPELCNSVELETSKLYPVGGGRMVEFNTDYPVTIGPKGYVEDGVLANRTKLQDCEKTSSYFAANHRLGFTVDGYVSWWGPEPVGGKFCICATKDEPCPGTFRSNHDSNVANKLTIRCKRGTGYAEIRTSQGGTRERFDPSQGAFTASINKDQSFIWGYATGGGYTGEYVALGAQIQLLTNSEISLKEETSDRIVPEGTYQFSTSQGHSISCTLKFP